MRRFPGTAIRFLVLLLPASALADEPLFRDVDPAAPFMRERYAAPISEDRGQLATLAKIHELVGMQAEALLIRSFAERRTLENLLGEPFKVPETVEQAMKQESVEKESIQDLRIRAMQLVSVTGIEKGATDEFIERHGGKHLGHGMWARLARQGGVGKAWMRVTARNRAPVPVHTFRIEVTEKAGRSDWRLSMNCFPDDRKGDKLFAPGAGSARCEVFQLFANDKPANDAIAAIGGGAAVNIRVTNLNTPEMDITERAVRSSDFDTSAAMNAREQLTKASCSELGNCKMVAERASAEEAGRQRAQERAARRQAEETAKRTREEQSHRRGTLGIIGVLLLAAGFALRTSNDEAEPGGGQAFFTGLTLLGSFFGLWSGVAMAFDWYPGYGFFLDVALAAVAALLLFIGLVGMGSGLAGQPERQTRFRLFVAGLGLLTPVYVGLVLFGLA